MEFGFWNKKIKGRNRHFGGNSRGNANKNWIFDIMELLIVLDELIVL